MDTTKRGLLTLIRSAITGQGYDLPEDFSLEDAYSAAKEGQVLALMYEGALRCGVKKDTAIMKTLRQDYYGLLVKSEKQMQMLQKIYAVFEEHGIDHMPLKGSVLKQQYPRPELRLMGDADILIRMEQYAKIKPLMRQMGFVECSETDHELVWRSPGLYLELHKRVVPASAKDFYRYFADGWKLAKHQDGCRYRFSDEDQLVYLFTHFAKHYRSGGIGCRHVVDLWVYRRAHLGMDEAYICAALEKLELFPFYENVMRMIAAWFEDGDMDEKSAYLTNVFFKGTYFGTRQEHMIASGAANATKMNSARTGRILRIWKALFPDHLYMRKKYPVLKKCGILLPVLWVWRWITAVLFRKENLSKLHDELKLTNADTVETFRQGLEYVGLGFHFKE